jgi:hypothetical protein
MRRSGIDRSAKYRGASLEHKLIYNVGGVRCASESMRQASQVANLLVAATNPAILSSKELVRSQFSLLRPAQVLRILSNATGDRYVSSDSGLLVVGVLSGVSDRLSSNSMPPCCWQQQTDCHPMYRRYFSRCVRKQMSNQSKEQISAVCWFNRKFYGLTVMRSNLLRRYCTHASLCIYSFIHSFNNRHLIGDDASVVLLLLLLLFGLENNSFSVCGSSL